MKLEATEGALYVACRLVKLLASRGLVRNVGLIEGVIGGLLPHSMEPFL